MRILLTGACGSLGRAIRKVGATNHTFSLFDTAPEVEGLGGICANITDRDAVMTAAQGCGAIIHTAAMHGAFYQKAPNADFIETNVLGTERLFSVAIQNGIRRIVISGTMEILIGKLWDRYGTALLDETLPPRPDWIYPVSKLLIEQLGQFYTRQKQLELVHLRYMGFGYIPPEKVNLDLLARYLDADDVARANLLAAGLPNVEDEVIHIGPDTPLTQGDIQTALNDPWSVLEKYWPGSSAVIKRLGLTPRGDHFWPVTRIDKAKNVLGWQPRVTFESWLRSQGWAPA